MFLRLTELDFLKNQRSDMISKHVLFLLAGLLTILIHGRPQEISLGACTNNFRQENVLKCFLSCHLAFQGDYHQKLQSCITVDGLPGHCRSESSCKTSVSTTSLPICGSTAHHLSIKVDAHYSSYHALLIKSSQSTTQSPCRFFLDDEGVLPSSYHNG